MSDPIESPFPYSVAVPGVGLCTVLDPEGVPGYRVQFPGGEVQSVLARSGNPSPENAAADIANPLAPEAPVPAVLRRSSFIVAARRLLGVTEGTVYALISQLPEGEQRETARDLWENALTFRRDNSFIAALAALNGNTSEELDEVFRAGAEINLD